MLDQYEIMTLIGMFPPPVRVYECYSTKTASIQCNHCQIVETTDILDKITDYQIVNHLPTCDHQYFKDLRAKLIGLLK